MQNNKIIVIVGPTATGKSRLAIDIAKEYNGEIISADSMQIYKNMDIGTAKPTIEEQNSIKHHMIDILEPKELFTLSTFLKMADDCIKNIISKNKIPIIAGGTGLYISSLIENFKLTEISTDNEYRKYLNDISKNGHGYILKQLLFNIDIDSYNKLHENDTKRLLRALEIYKYTKMTKTQHDKISTEIKSDYNYLVIGLNYLNRNDLYKKINDRVDLMMSNGLLNEVINLDLEKCSLTARQAIGYKQFIDYFNNKITLEQTIENIKQDSRKYAKRQLTWFKAKKNIEWIEFNEYNNKIIYKNSKKLIEKFLYM